MPGSSKWSLSFKYAQVSRKKVSCTKLFNTLNANLNPICHLLAILGTHHILHVSRIRVKKCNTQTLAAEFPFLFLLFVTNVKKNKFRNRV
jgi:hypothetical protein